MTQNSEMVLNFLKTNYGTEYTKQEIADALHISVPAVTGSINGLLRKGKTNGVDYIVERVEEVEVEDGVEVEGGVKVEGGKRRKQESIFDLLPEDAVVLALEHNAYDLSPFLVPTDRTPPRSAPAVPS